MNRPERTQSRKRRTHLITHREPTQHLTSYSLHYVTGMVTISLRNVDIETEFK